MKIRLFYILVMAVMVASSAFSASAESTRKERRLINRGNTLYKERKFVEAQSLYQEAIAENPTSAEARYNLGLSQVRQVANPADTSSRNRTLLDGARKSFSEVASLAKTKPGLAAKANFNLGNLEFNAKDYQKAIEYYKQALRIDPSDDKARKNLRIAQKNLQKKNQDQNKDNNQENQDKDKNDKEQENEKNKNDKDQNQDQNKDKDQKDDSRQNLSQQSAAQILQAIDNKESTTRARVNKANKGDKSEASGRNTRRW